VGQAGGGSAAYFLGFIGALVFFWQQANGFGEHLVALLKAFVWPAFLVYEAFQAFAG
jgi:hypothetical protein